MYSVDACVPKELYMCKCRSVYPQLRVLVCEFRVQKEDYI